MGPHPHRQAAEVADLPTPIDVALEPVSTAVVAKAFAVEHQPDIINYRVLLRQVLYQLAQPLPVTSLHVHVVSNPKIDLLVGEHHGQDHAVPETFRELCTFVEPHVPSHVSVEAKEEVAEKEHDAQQHAEVAGEEAQDLPHPVDVERE